MIRRPPRSTQSRSSAASDVYKRQGQGGRISKRNENSAAVGQRFLCMQVGGGDDRLSGSKRICQGAARYLLRVEVRRDVDVAREQQLDDVALRHVFIDEGDVVLNSEALDRLDELIAVLLAIVAAQLRVSLARDHV